jgi:polysaccharide export outer membrane protein
MNSHRQFRRESSHPYFVYIIFILLAQSCSTFPCLAQETADTTKPEFATRHPRYRMGLGDVIDIDFPLVPEFNQVVTIQPDGFISLKSVGDIHVQGLSSPETVEAIRAAYKDILHAPVLAITLKDFEKPYFTALGKVMRPGKYDLRGDTTVTQAIAMAGGLDDSAKHSQVLLFRHADADRVEIKTIDVKAMLKTGNMAEDLHLRPGDMIMVPKNTLSKVRPWIPNQSMGMYMNGL